jgi:hypothetical protein
LGGFLSDKLDLLLAVSLLVVFSSFDDALLTVLQHSIDQPGKPMSHCGVAFGAPSLLRKRRYHAPRYFCLWSTRLGAADRRYRWLFCRRRYDGEFTRSPARLGRARRFFDLQMLTGRRNFLTPTLAPSTVLTRLTTSRTVHSSLRNGPGCYKPGGRLLFTDPIALTGPLTNAEVAVRSSAGSYLFVAHGYDESAMAQCGLRLLALTRIIPIILEAISYS